MRKPADLAEALHERESTAVQAILSLPPEQAAMTLYKLDQPLREHVMLALQGHRRLPSILQQLPPDEVADLLLPLSDEATEAQLDQLTDGSAIRALLAWPADSAGGIMDSRLMTVREEETSETARAALRQQLHELDHQKEAYVVDEAGQLLGTVNLLALLLSPSDCRVADLMTRDCESVEADLDREQVAARMERCDLDAMPVVDAGGKLLGQVTLTDAISVLKEEAEEDLRYMSGLSRASRAVGGLWRVVETRLPWLLAGMVGSMLGALIIMRFEGALEQAAVLAAFIPLIAATAGNAGIQSSTVTVQDLARGRFRPERLLPRLSGELGGAILNGTAISLVICLFLVLLQWVSPDKLYADGALALTLSVSLVSVILIASLIGTLVPPTLARLGIDPAVATGPFITVTNDVIGVMIYFLAAQRFYLG